MKLAVGIVTTASRDSYLKDTLKNLQQQSPECNIQVFCDLEEGLTRNHRASWQKLFEDPEVTHALLIQDDVIAAKNWYKTAQLLIERLPIWKAISLYSSLSAAQNEKINTPYITLNPKQWINEQAMILSREAHEWVDTFIISGMWKDYVENYQKQYRHHDVLLREALVYKQWRVAVPCPPIFQHVGVESTVGNPWRAFGRERKSQGFKGVQWDSYEYFKERLQ